MNILEILKKVQAVITDDHFVYTSGKHGSIYINKDAIYPHTAYSSMIGMLFAEQTADLDIEVVIAPALGGIVLSQWTAYHLSQMNGKDILGIYTEKDLDNNQVLRRGYNKLVENKNVLVIEDLTNTGGSVVKVIKTAKEAGAKIIKVGVMVNRDPQHVNEQTLGYPFFSLADLPAEAFDPSNCVLCERGIPINTTVGHGKKFLEQK